VVSLLALLAGCAAEAPPGPPAPESLEAFDVALAEWIVRGLERIEEHPDNPRTFLNLCMIYDANGLDDLAERCYESFLEWQPDEARGWYHLARVQDRRGDGDSAVSSLRRGLASFAHYAPARALLGEWLLEAGDLAAAEIEFDRALEIDPRHAGGRLGKARLSLADGKPHDAIRLLNETRRLHPDDGRLVYWLSEAKSRVSGEADLDVAGLAEAEAHPADDPWAAELAMYHVNGPTRLRVVGDLLDENRPAEARELLEELHHDDPQNVEVSVRLGRLELKEGRIDEGRTLLEEALAGHPDHVGVHYELASACELSGDTACALDHIGRALELAPGQGPIHSRRAAILRRMGRYEEAIASFVLAEELQPEQQQIKVAIGDCFARLADWSQAAGSYERALALDDADPDLHARVGFVYLKLGRWDDAESALQQSLARGSRRPDAVQQLLDEVRRRR
jgi:tetratricopeptide (TPR) repeat protein